MPRKRIFGWRQYRCIAVGVALIGASLGQVAGAVSFTLDKSFTLDNQSDVVITRVEAIPDYEREWGENLLGSAVLEPGNQRRFDVSAQADHCAFDIRVHWAAGSTRSFLNRDLCEDAQVVFDGAEDARTVSFTLDNQSDVVILRIEASPDYAREWGEDLLGSAVLGPGNQRRLDVSAGAGHCLFDIRVHWAESTRSYWGRDLCEDADVVFDGAEDARTVSFALDNQSDVVILRIEASPDYAREWGEDLLGSAVLGPGNQRRLDVSARAGHCLFDIRVHWAESTRSYLGRDLCEDAHVVFDGGDDAPADVRGLVVSNQSRVTIGIVEAVPHGEEPWGSDRLGEDELILPGNEHVIRLEDVGTNECEFDIRLRTLERNVEYRRRNLCDDPRIIFYEGNELTVVNESDSHVYFIRVSTDHEGQGWGQDLLAEGLLSQGEEMATRLHEFAESQCLLDLLIEDGDEEHVYEQVDICRTERFVHPQTSPGPVAGDPSPPIISPPDLAPGEAFRDCDDWGCPWMVVVNGGRFERGSWERDDETPVTAVTVPGPFAVGQFEVSVGQFDEFVRDAGYDAGGGCYMKRGSKWRWSEGVNWRNPGFEQDDSHPVVCVDWEDATAYTRWLTDKTGVPYRLLTEAEAELLARASAINFEEAGRANCRDCGSKWDGKRTSPVGGLRPDRLGLSGVFGNAAEWVLDCYQSGYSNAPRDGSAWSPPSCERRVVRGGCWLTKAQKLRPSARDHGELDRRSGCVGFRVAREMRSLAE